MTTRKKLDIRCAKNRAGAVQRRKRRDCLDPEDIDFIVVMKPRIFSIHPAEPCLTHGVPAGDQSFCLEFLEYHDDGSPYDSYRIWLGTEEYVELLSVLAAGLKRHDIIQVAKPDEGGA